MLISFERRYNGFHKFPKIHTPVRRFPFILNCFERQYNDLYQFSHKQNKHQVRFLSFQISRMQNYDRCPPKHGFGAWPANIWNQRTSESSRIHRIPSTERGAHPRNTRAGGQDDSSSEQAPSNYIYPEHNCGQCFLKVQKIQNLKYA